MMNKIVLIVCLLSMSFFLHAQSCEDCHDYAPSLLAKTAHAGIACMTCHGEAPNHVEDPSLKNAPRVDSLLCRRCHEDKPAGIKMAIPAHHQNGVVCLDCHDLAHGEGGHPVMNLLRGKKDQACIKCHQEINVQRHRPYRHRVACYECHTPHGEAREVDAMCTACHEEKRGPFIYDHLSQKVGSCLTCHQPHGSPNPHLLIRSQVRFLCLECHVATPTIHDPSQEAFKNCVLCHNEIHGSDRNKNFLE